jgi:hypothetical protein
MSKTSKVKFDLKNILNGGIGLPEHSAIGGSRRRVVGGGGSGLGGRGGRSLQVRPFSSTFLRQKKFLFLNFGAKKVFVFNFGAKNSFVVNFLAPKSFCCEIQVENANLFANFFSENIIKIITSVPVSRFIRKLRPKLIRRIGPRSSLRSADPSNLGSLDNNPAVASLLEDKSKHFDPAALSSFPLW